MGAVALMLVAYLFEPLEPLCLSGVTRSGPRAQVWTAKPLSGRQPRS